MCDFCSNTGGLTVLNYTVCTDCIEYVYFCEDCGKLVKKDGCNIVYHGHDQKYYCSDCMPNHGAKVCPKCGVSHYGDNLLCQRCERKWFVCADCGKIKTKVRSGLSEYDSLRYEEHLPDGEVCTKCFEDKYKNQYTPKRVKSCRHCGQWHSLEGDYCLDCEARIYTCSCCGDKKVSGKKILADGSIICYNCYTIKYFQCDECGIIKKKGEEHGLTGICNDCAKDKHVCDKCGKLKKGHNKVPDFDLYFCDSCFGYEVGECVCCGEIKYDKYYGVCPTCRGELKINYVRNYSVKMPVHLTGKKHQPHYGIENEISFKFGRPEMFTGMFSKFLSKDLILKSDSSINNGFECVWKPFSFSEFKAYDFKDAFPEKVLNISKSCGMHVHINKSAFKNTHMYKFINFFYSNWDFIWKIAERNSSSYCKVNNEKPTKLAKNKHGYGRYALNLENTNTIEVRIFQGVIDQEKFRKNVEFLDALYYFTLNNSLKDAKNKELFVEYVMKSSYNNLKAFLKGLV